METTRATNRAEQIAKARDLYYPVKELREMIAAGDYDEALEEADAILDAMRLMNERDKVQQRTPQQEHELDIMRSRGEL